MEFLKFLWEANEQLDVKEDLANQVATNSLKIQVMTEHLVKMDFGIIAFGLVFLGLLYLNTWLENRKLRRRIEALEAVKQAQ